MAGIVNLLLLWIVAEASYQSKASPVETSMPSKTFRCNNGKYIESSLFCDGGMEDCGDLSDESFGCNTYYCGRGGKFKCHSDGPCIEINDRCNTILNCPDGSDELQCGEETEINNCTLHNGKFLCQDLLKCLDFNYTCDGTCNCFDCSDETPDCSKFDSDSCSACPHYCIPTPSGPQCACNSSTYSTSKLCSEIKNCTGDSDFRMCEQNCIHYKDRSRCFCYDDHHEMKKNHRPDMRCRSNVWLNNKLIYSTTTKIKASNIDDDWKKAASFLWQFSPYPPPPPPYPPGFIRNAETIKNSTHCTAVTAAKNYTYFAARIGEKDTIFKTLIGGNETGKIIELDSSVKSLAVDWITSNVYFTNNGSLSVCSNDGRICTQIKCCSVDYVSLATKFGWMFYTHKGFEEENESLIMKSNMDGSEETVFIDKTFSYPVTLAAEEWTERLYLFEVKTQQLRGFSLMPNDRAQFDHVQDLTEYNFSPRFSAIEQQLFFIKNRTNAVYISNDAVLFYDLSFIELQDRGTGNVRHIYAYNPTLQDSFEIGNPCSASSCKGLCLLRPHSPSTNTSLHFTCTCENFVPTEDNPWCIAHAVDATPKLITSPILRNETKFDSSTKMYSTFSWKNDASSTTTVSSALSLSPATRAPTCESYFAIVVSCVAFMSSIFSCFCVLRSHYSIKYCRKVDICEQMELN